MTNEERDIQRKLKVLQHAEKIVNARKACRYFGVGRSSFYRWRATRTTPYVGIHRHGAAGLAKRASYPHAMADHP